MMEEEAIDFASLHLEGDALEWWHHGIANQDYANIITFKEFTRRLVRRFDRKKKNDYFQELNSLR